MHVHTCDKQPKRDNILHYTKTKHVDVENSKKPSKAFPVTLKQGAIRKYRHQFIEYFTGVSLSCHCRSNGHTTQTKAKKCVEGRVIIIYKHSCIYGLTPLSQAVSFGHKIFPRFWGCSNVVRSSPDQGLHSSSVRE